MGLLQHGHHTCPLSPPGTTGTGAVVHSQISIHEARTGELGEHPLFTVQALTVCVHAHTYTQLDRKKK